MLVGVIVPQGWTGDYDGWDAAAAWRRTVDVPSQAERLGSESVWLSDHVHTLSEPTDEITLQESAHDDALEQFAAETRAAGATLA